MFRHLSRYLASGTLGCFTHTNERIMTGANPASATVAAKVAVEAFEKL